MTSIGAGRRPAQGDGGDMFASYTQASVKALENLRNTGHFGWYLVLVIVFVWSLKWI